MSDVDSWDYEGMDEVVCPHCGYEHDASWERSDEGEDECDECGKRFAWRRDTWVTYTTQKSEVTP